jgi:hypothetical protein
VADHDRPQRQVDAVEVVEGVERHACDDSGQREGQDQQQAHGVAAEERHAVDGKRGARAEDERDRGGGQAGANGQAQRRAHLWVVPGRHEPFRRQAGDGPALDVRGVERVQKDQQDREEEKEEDKHGPDPKRDPSPETFHQRASKAPRRRAAKR